MRLMLVGVFLAAPSALAFPWMVKHNYGSCAACHVDPSGGAQLTEYGRAQAELLVKFRVSPPPPEAEEEVPPTANFLWAIDLPEVINLSGNFRNGVLVRPGGTPVAVPLLMASELYGTVNIAERVVLHGTAGFGVRNQVAPAIVAPLCDPNDPASLPSEGPFAGQCGPSFIARQYWAGVRLADDAVMIRAGRMNLPFGLRNNEHITYVRTLTQSDINIHQQVGLSVSYNSESLRGEVMGIAGNFQLGPDAYRERGYSAYAEYAFSPTTYLGVSSLLTFAQAGPEGLVPHTRHAHGLFFRYAPVSSLALLAEADFLAWVVPPALDRLGFAALLQADYEPIQGLHFLVTLEGAHAGRQQGPSLGAWASVAWYFWSHFELRLDNIVRRADGTQPFTYQLLAQLHFFL